MFFILIFVALFFVQKKLSTIKKRNNELVKEEKNVIMQQNMQFQCAQMAAASGIAIPTFNMPGEENPLGSISSEYERNQKVANILRIAFYIIIAIALFKLAFPWLKILAVIGPKDFIKMLSI